MNNAIETSNRRDQQLLIQARVTYLNVWLKEVAEVSVRP